MKFVKYVDNGKLIYRPMSSKDIFVVDEEGIVFLETGGKKYMVSQHATNRLAEIAIDNELRRDMVKFR